MKMNIVILYYLLNWIGDVASLNVYRYWNSGSGAGELRRSGNLGRRTYNISVLGKVHENNLRKNYKCIQ